MLSRQNVLRRAPGSTIPAASTLCYSMRLTEAVEQLCPQAEVSKTLCVTTQQSQGYLQAQNQNPLSTCRSSCAICKPKPPLPDPCRPLMGQTLVYICSRVLKQHICKPIQHVCISCLGSICFSLEINLSEVLTLHQDYATSVSGCSCNKCCMIFEPSKS